MMQAEGGDECLRGISGTGYDPVGSRGYSSVGRTTVGHMMNSSSIQWRLSGGRAQGLGRACPATVCYPCKWEPVCCNREHSTSREARLGRREPQLDQDGITTAELVYERLRASAIQTETVFVVA